MNFDLNLDCGSYLGDESGVRSGDVDHSGDESDESRCNGGDDMQSSSPGTDIEADECPKGQQSRADRDGCESEIGVNSSWVEEFTLSMEEMLEVGMDVGNLEDAHFLYCQYGGFMGFSVRKGSQEYFNHTYEPRMKLFHCSCEGRPDNKASHRRLAAFKKQSYRSHCKAKLWITRSDVESSWKVSSLFKAHNHELVKPTESYLLRSLRQMSAEKKNLILGMKRNGIGVSRAFRFLESEAGSRANLGFLLKDVYNELDREKRSLSKVDNADANRLLEYLRDRGLSDPSFYWKVQLNDDGRLKNLFFRDTRCLIDYQLFGDVVSIDATYKTNKYDLICVPLVGINHHRTNVMFGVAFLSNEKSDSYEWLFSTFLEVMYKKEPAIIFSDQDQALMNALDCTFRQSSHRLCQWHVNKNAVRHFGKLNEDVDFKNLWYTCMNGCENDIQFESTWRRMIEQHGLAENKWFSAMYNLRKRWSTAFTREKFSGGLHATSQSELTNKVLKELCKSTSTLYDFVVCFERLQKNWRTREFEEDVHNRGRPGMFVQNTGILVQLGEICTRNVFKLFEYEAVNTISVDLTQEPLDLNSEIWEYRVSSRRCVNGYRVVKFNQVTKFGFCSCRMWETEGVLCRHLFRVYFHLNLHRIPEEMFLNRWRKDSKERSGLSRDWNDTLGSNKFSNMVFVNYNTKLVYDLLSECKDSSICRDAISEHIRKMVDAVKKLQNETMCDNGISHSREGFKEPYIRPIRNPISKKNRPMRRKRINKDWEGRGFDGASTSRPLQGDDECLEATAGVQFSRDEDLDRFSMD